MKKILVFLFVIAIVLSGCGKSLSDNNFPEMYRADLSKKTSEANVRLLNSHIDDVASFTRVLDLIAVSMNKKKPFGATFLYETPSGRVVSLQTIEGNLRYIGDEYRELMKADFINAILDQLQDQDLDIGDDGNIIGTILSWEDGGTKYSVCDFDGDGIWDYGSRSMLMFSSVASYKEDKPYREVNEFEKISLTSISDKEIIILDNLEGGETLNDFKKIL